MRRAIKSVAFLAALWPSLALAQTPLPNPIILPPNTIVGRGNLGSSGYPYAMSFQEFVSTLSSLGLATAQGTASGDLSGSYPGPTVAKINGVAPPNSGLWKGNGSGGAVAAVSGTDYAPATTGSSILKASGGGFVNAAAGIDYAPATPGTAILIGNGAGGFTSFAGISAVSHQWINGISAGGVGTQSQPACGDLSNAAASCSMDTTNAGNISSGLLAVARGGTGDSGSAWTTYTPTVSCNSGTITTLGTVTGRYKTIGKTVHVYVSIQITTVGTCTGSITASLPVASVNTSTQSLSGRENGVTGHALVGAITANTSNVIIANYDNSTPAASGAVVEVEGVYESN